MDFSHNINFPGLGIYLRSVGRFIDINGFEIAYYGIIIAIAMLVGFGVSIKYAKLTNQNHEEYYTLGIIGIIAGIVGARLYYVIFAWDEFRDNPIEVFNIRGGGLAIYGGIIGAVLTIIIWSRIKSRDTWLVLDTVSVGIVIGQVIGRWGNFFNREVFGGFTKSFIRMEIPINAVNDSSDITTQMLNNTIVRKGVEYISVHPTFLYESLWNLAIFIFLMLYRKHAKRSGETFLIYLGLYGIGRAIIELVRTDQLMMIGINIPVSMFIGIITFILATVMFIYRRKTK